MMTEIKTFSIEKEKEVEETNTNKSNKKNALATKVIILNYGPLSKKVIKREKLIYSAKEFYNLLAWWNEQNLIYGISIKNNAIVVRIFWDKYFKYNYKDK